jgi:hypothetical protein
VGNCTDSDEQTYSVYRLEVRCNIALPNGWSVYRRYSQFRTLSDTLRSEGYTVPVLPPKTLFSTLSLDFVRKRKVELEQWLHNLNNQYSNYSGGKDPNNNASYRAFLIDNANVSPPQYRRLFPKERNSILVAPG